jgi:para-nitrobenzyl esterase
MANAGLRIAIFLAVAPSCLAAGALAPMRVKNGWVQGYQDGELAVYLGIPFAAPPVGALRWRPPEPVANWTGVRPATEYAATPIQKLEAWEGPLHVSEDCLYLNVWTPAKSSRDGLPVMVWIYGGGFSGGSTAIGQYHGEPLARHGVVIVSIAYRVGALGFLALPELSAESPHHASGNYGLLDQIAGLKWVQRNIASFGGDPRRVTIFGESAGGIAVNLLAASPLARGLFRGAISESGGSMGPTRTPPTFGENMQLLSDYEKDGVRFERGLGAGSLAQLRQVTVQQILNASPGLGRFWPVVDGWVVPGDLCRLYEQGRQNDTNILVGLNSDEGALFGGPPSRDAYVGMVKSRFGPFADKILSQYPADADSWRQSGMDLIRDAGFGWNTWSWARLQARTGKGRAYMYYFDHIPPRSPAVPWAHAIGTAHSEEEPYVFGNFDQTLRWSPQDRRLGQEVSTYWTDFAKYGTPNGNGLPEWTAFSDSSPRVMYFTDRPRVGDLPNRRKLEVLDAYYAWRRTPEGEGWARHLPVAPRSR